MPLPTALLVAEGPAADPLNVSQGSTLYREHDIQIDGVVEDLTGFTVTGRISTDWRPDGALTIALTCGLVSGNLAYYYGLTPAETAALAAASGDPQPVDIGVFEVEISDGTDIVTLERGRVILSREPALT